MDIKLIQLDGDMPNMALMKLAHYFRTVRGATVHFTRSVRRDLFEPEYDYVLASMIFSSTAKKAGMLKENFPNAIIGGTGISDAPEHTIENFLGIAPDYKQLDYTLYPNFDYSIGMTQIGCTNTKKTCPFCGVPEKEGRNRPFADIKEIYRGEPYPKKLILIDNDFQSRRDWQEICQEIIDGSFEVAFIQGINIRKITRHHVPFFKQMKFRDKNFNKKRFYCAWDREDDRAQIERGLNLLSEAGISRSAVTPYFICNYWQKGLSEDVWNRFLSMAEWGLRPYVMIWNKWELPARDELKIFQNWVNTYNCYKKPTREGFEEYRIYYLNPYRQIEETERTDEFETADLFS